MHNNQLYIFILDKISINENINYDLVCEINSKKEYKL